MVSTRGSEDTRQPGGRQEVWRMPLNLNVPRTGSFPSQIPELPGNNTTVGPAAQCSRILRDFFLGLQEGGGM